MVFVISSCQYNLTDGFSYAYDNVSQQFYQCFIVSSYMSIFQAINRDLIRPLLYCTLVGSNRSEVFAIFDRSMKY